MDLSISSEDICEISASAYPGDSKPLSYVQYGDNPQSVEWWTSNPRLEAPGDRHRSAVQSYLQLSQLATAPHEADCFPAVFRSADCKRFRPDKGVIKTLLEHGFIEARENGPELMFELIMSGQSWNSTASLNAATI